MRKTKQKVYRQGDVLLVRTSQVPAECKPLASAQGRLILAHGEVTGHHHSVAETTSTALLAGPNSEMFLLVKEGDALLEHQEHAPIRLAVGTYRVQRQREYSPEAIRNVMD